MLLTHSLALPFAHFISPHLVSQPGIIRTGYRVAMLTSHLFQLPLEKLVANITCSPMWPSLIHANAKINTCKTSHRTTWT